MRNQLLTRVTVRLVLVTVLTASSAAWADLPEIACFNDYNHNGELESGEFAACAETPQGPLCRLDPIPCTHTADPAACPAGSTLNPAADRCEAPLQYACGAGGTRYSNQADCVAACDRACEPVCAAGLSRMESLCTAPPICETGAYDAFTDTCNRYFCPYGDAHECRDYNNGRFCSRLDCIDTTAAVLPVGRPEGADDPADNGPRDEANQCLGRIYLFSGRDRNCRSGGSTVAFEDCCRDDAYLFDLIDCTDAEISLSRIRGQGLCHYIGEYCSQEMRLLLGRVCVETSRRYCCFGSRLARIVHEQGRAQLNTFANGWGTPENPNCRGFTPEEFQTLDFSRIDLSEWHGSIETRPQAEIEDNLRQGITDFYENLEN